jgi:hypothetical protein
MLLFESTNNFVWVTFQNFDLWIITVLNEFLDWFFNISKPFGIRIMNWIDNLQSWSSIKFIDILLEPNLDFINF